MIKVKFGVYQNSTLVEKYIWEIMDPDYNWGSLSLQEQINRAASLKMLPSSYKNNGETYCRNADRTANNELQRIENVNYKSKVEFTWKYLEPLYLSRLLTFLQFKDNYKNAQGDVQSEDAPMIKVTYVDFLRERTIDAYLGQSIDAELVEYDNKQYWESLRLAFPER